MDPIINLVKFNLDECSVKWLGENIAFNDIDYRYSMDYHVWANDDNERLFKLQLMLKIEPVEDISRGYVIDCKITGIFVFPEETDRAKRPLILRMNGTAILFGVLRGQIASLTGMFEGGVLSLPTINMKDAVNKIEEEKSKSVNQDQAPKLLEGQTEEKEVFRSKRIKSSAGGASSKRSKRKE